MRYKRTVLGRSEQFFYVHLKFTQEIVVEVPRWLLNQRRSDLAGQGFTEKAIALNLARDVALKTASPFRAIGERAAHSPGLWDGRHPGDRNIWDQHPVGQIDLFHLVVFARQDEVGTQISSTAWEISSSMPFSGQAYLAGTAPLSVFQWPFGRQQLCDLASHSSFCCRFVRNQLTAPLTTRDNRGTPLVLMHEPPYSSVRRLVALFRN